MSQTQSLFNTQGMGDVDASTGPTFLSGIYKGTVGLGQFRATFGFIVGIIFLIVISVISMYMIFFNKDSDYLYVEGIIEKSECVSTHSKEYTLHKCSLTIRYSVDGQEYSKDIFSNTTTSYFANEPVSLWVSKKDNYNVSLADGILSTFSSRTNGIILLVSGIVLFSIIYLNYYLTHTYEVYASTSGIGTLGSLLR